MLTISVPKTKMEGPPEVYVKAGSTVNLRCTISRTLEEPAYMFWYKDSERVLNHDRSLISMERLNVDTIVSIHLPFGSFFLNVSSENEKCSV